QYQPIHVVDQVISIYAGSQGFLDKVPVDQVLEAEAAIMSAMRESHPEVRGAVAEAKVIEGDTEQKLRKVLEDVVNGFLSGHGHDPR
ncbi:MAG: F0F1 ATP synthase subunit alpha, partial [Planctomycetota bacterium]